MTEKRKCTSKTFRPTKIKTTKKYFPFEFYNNYYVTTTKNSLYKKKSYFFNPNKQKTKLDRKSSFTIDDEFTDSFRSTTKALLKFNYVATYNKKRKKIIIKTAILNNSYKNLQKKSIISKQYVIFRT